MPASSALLMPRAKMLWWALAATAVLSEGCLSFVVGPHLLLRPCPRSRGMLRGKATVVMQRKDFDKKYDKAFDDFRTSGSMPSIPSVSEQYGNAAAYVRDKGVVVEGDEGFGERLTEAQQELQNMKDAGLTSYEELKKDLIADTVLLGSMALSLSLAFLDEKMSFSYGIGFLGSIAYSFLLTRTADRLGEQGSRSTLFDPGTPARFAILFILIVASAKNKETLSILPMLFGFFVPYKLASLRPAFVSAPTIGQYEVRVYRHIGQSPDTPPYKVEYGSAVAGKKEYSSLLSTTGSSGSDMKTQGSSAPLGKRKILSVEEQYEALKKGTID